MRVALDRDDIDLRFLVHFVSSAFQAEHKAEMSLLQIGDVHQPLHLTGRERGGNGDPVIFEGRHMSLHGEPDP